MSEAKYSVTVYSQIAHSQQAKSLLSQFWGNEKIVTKGIIHDAATLDGFVIIDNNQLIGLITYNFVDNECEIVTLNSIKENIGLGTKLIDSVIEVARERNCNRVWLITTNDNLAAIKFYQNRGFKLIAIHKNTIEKSRKLKPEIPLYGNDGITIRDEIELEFFL